MKGSSIHVKPEPVMNLAVQFGKTAMCTKDDKKLGEISEATTVGPLGEERVKAIISIMESLGESLEVVTKRTSKSQKEYAVLKDGLKETVDTMNALCGKSDDMYTEVTQQKRDLEYLLSALQTTETRLDTLECETASVRYTLDSRIFESTREDFDQANGVPFSPNQTEGASAPRASSPAVEMRQNNLILADRWSFGEKIGSGSGGWVCQVYDMLTGTWQVAKVEIVDNQKQSLLRQEYRTYEHIHHPEATYGFSRVHHFSNTGPFNVLILDYFGRSLHEYFQSTHSPDIVFQVAIQCLDRIKTLHEKRIVHRDIKPENFLVDFTSDGLLAITLIDFGLSACIPSNGYGYGHRGNPGQRLPFIGTPLYGSVAAHQGIPQGPKDDLESFGYVIVKLLTGFLPWEAVNSSNTNEYGERTLRRKLEVTAAELCVGLPEELVVFFKHVHSLNVGDRPDYAGLRFLLVNALTQEQERANME
ncbi:Serine/threonine protein kinase [Chondrus crispus]|uniref:non-specific serine/threonine protein kinase n=1 Tax=Chondrus crispus TaxID=2769 RepID=R7Q8E5_CHOCR|nr:Serine/threonine protein kinase [Chondrus crispus]CDF34058.1 Serine/threonine protein kinase [Chondrus crispus]|eukprot:XP_005713877.1 Serine/threonine protein kinase [Chondrus crispus]